MSGSSGNAVAKGVVSEDGEDGVESAAVRYEVPSLSSEDWLTYHDADGHHLHLWAVTEPYEGALLKLHPMNPADSVNGVIRFRNSRGDCVNECTIATRNGYETQGPIALDLEAFLSTCETDGGMLHSHIEVVTSAPCYGEIQLSTSVRSVLLPPLHTLNDRAARAIPVTLSSKHSHVLALVNPFERQCSVRCRLYVDTRTPEEVCLVPPNGVLLISPEVLFFNVMRDIDVQDEIQGYLRLSTRFDRAVGFQLIEEYSFSERERVLGVVG